MKLNVEMTDEEYENYKIYLNRHIKMDITEFLKLNGFTLENSHEEETFRGSTIIVNEYIKDGIVVTVEEEK